MLNEPKHIQFDADTDPPEVIWGRFPNCLDQTEKSEMLGLKAPLYCFVYHFQAYTFMRKA